MPMRTGTPLPSFEGATEWINGEPDAAELHGNPVLVHFWAVSCHICHENMPTVNRWRDEYGPKGLKFVAIHMPRQEIDTDVERVKLQIGDFGITQPCAIDNEHTLTEAFENQNLFVPAYYLFDREGKMRSRAAGDAGTAMLEAAIKRQFEGDAGA
jgi:thiol-disulfide isomerase/thioredoxin